MNQKSNLEDLIRPVDNRVKWLLHESKRFEVYEKKWSFQKEIPQLEGEENILGVYVTSKEDEGLIVVTNVGMYISKQTGWESFKYVSMEDVKFPGNYKFSWNHLIVELKTRDTVKLPMPIYLADGEKHYDVFPFY